MLLPQGLKALCFDFDGTLCHRRPSSLDVFFLLLERADVHITAEARRNTRRFVHYYWAQSPEAEKDIETYGRMTPTFWEQYLKRKLLAFGLDQERADDLSSQLQPGMEEEYQPQPWVPDDVRPTLSTLNETGFILGLVSNRSLSITEELQDLNLAKYFHFSYTAGEINSWKPEKEIFEFALDLAQSTPENTAFIGDNYYADILGAQKVGLYTILIDPHNTFPEVNCPVIGSIGELVEPQR